MIAILTSINHLQPFANKAIYTLTVKLSVFLHTNIQISTTILRDMAGHPPIYIGYTKR